MADLLTLPLDALHTDLGGRMVPFAGYSMAVQYEGVMAEHLHCRAAAGLFDVSHMGQVILRPKSSLADTALALETLVPADILALPEGRQRYSQFTNENGGIEDDLMIANRGDDLFLVVNAACKAKDIAHMTSHLSEACEVIEITDRCLLALQGPKAENVLSPLVPEAAAMHFMDVAQIPSTYGTLWISRSGYTGEDGFEVSVENTHAEALARALLAHNDCAPIGLGARDSLRLEAGLCLYGHDIDATTSPIEAGLQWSIQKSRRAGGARPGGFPGAKRILDELENGTGRTRVGLRPEGRAPMREGTALLHNGKSVGIVTSGGFGPSVGAPVAMGYVSGSEINLTGEVRGKHLPVNRASLPFIPANFKR